MREKRKNRYVNGDRPRCRRKGDRGHTRQRKVRGRTGCSVRQKAESEKAPMRKEVVEGVSGGQGHMPAGGNFGGREKGWLLTGPRFKVEGWGQKWKDGKSSWTGPEGRRRRDRYCCSAAGVVCVPGVRPSVSAGVAEGNGNGNSLLGLLPGCQSVKLQTTLSDKRWDQ